MGFVCQLSFSWGEGGGGDQYIYRWVLCVSSPFHGGREGGGGDQYIYRWALCRQLSTPRGGPVPVRRAYPAEPQHVLAGCHRGSSGPGLHRRLLRPLPQRPHPAAAAHAQSRQAGWRFLQHTVGLPLSLCLSFSLSLFRSLSVSICLSLSLFLSLSLIILIITAVVNVVTIVLCVAYWHVD